MSSAEPVTARYGFLLVPEYSMMAFTAAIDQMRMAKYRAKKIVRWLRSLSDPPIDLA